MAVFDVASIVSEGKELTLVFLTPEATYLNDVSRRQLWDMLISSANRSGFSGEVIAVWEFEGKIRFMAPLEFHTFLSSRTIADLQDHICGQMECGEAPVVI